jgi:hypothetical protein
VFTGGEHRVTFKSFFSGETYERYRAELWQYYPDRWNQFDHPGGGLLDIPELNAVAWCFPFDPQLVHLHRALDLAWVQDLLERRSTVPLRPKILTYYPEQGSIVAYRDNRRVVAYGKAGRPHHEDPTFDVMDRLWWSLERAEGRLRVARPLAYEPEVNFLLQAPVGGRTIRDDRNSRLFLDLVKSAAEALALIHNGDIPFGRERPLQQELGRLESSLPELELTSPLLYQTMQLLVRQVMQRIKPEEHVELVPSHGDYKWNQFLHYRGRFSLIDFEFFCQAERWFDVGYFCGYLPTTSPKDWRDTLAVEVLRTSFLETYQRISGVPLDLERIGMYESITLALRTLTFVWSHVGHWQLRASQLLDLGIERLVSPDPRPLPEQAPLAAIA